MARGIFQEGQGMEGRTLAGSDGHGAEPLVLDATGAERIEIPDSGRIASATLVREGSDLILHGDDGSVVVLEGYFTQTPPPVIHSADGTVLGPQMVSSFVQNAEPVRYAENGLSMNDAGPVGAVSEITGQAHVTRTDGTREALQKGAPIFEGDVIETGADGAVSLFFVDETEFSVSRNARLAIDEYVYDPETESGSSEFSVLRGLFMFSSGLIGRTNPDEVEIRMPMGSIGIRGTMIAGDADTGEVSVIEGAIVLRSMDGVEMTLAERFETARLDAGGLSHEGVRDAAHIQNNFAPLGDVSPVFFSGIGAEPRESGSETSPADSRSSPENSDNQAPVDSSTQPDQTVSGTEANATQTQDPAPLPPPPPTTTTDPLRTLSTDSQTSSGTGSSPETSTRSGTSSTSTTTTTTSTSTSPTEPVRETTTQTNTDTTQSPPNSGTVLPSFLLLNETNHGVIRLNGQTSGLRFGSSVSAIQDDGGLKLLVGAMDGIRTYAPDMTTMTFESVPNATGMTLVAGGDFDKDGTIDFAWGMPNYDDSRGRVSIESDGTTYDIFGNSDGILVGSALASIGDINGDGLDDFLVGVPGHSGGYGSAFIIPGGSEDASYPDQFASLMISGTTSSSQLGTNVSSAGYFNGDALADFMVSAPGEGTVNLYRGVTNPDTPFSLMTQFTGIQVLNNEIPIASMGDMNGDGRGDILIVSQTMTHQSYHFYYGNAAPPPSISVNAATADLTVHNSAGHTILAGGHVGDFNGDGFDDTLIIVRGHNAPAGLVDLFVLYGNHTLSGTVSTNDLFFNNAPHFRMQYQITDGTLPRDMTFTISALGDRNGDGFEDFALGLPDAGADDRGQVILVNGRNPHIAGKTHADRNGDSLVGTPTTDMFNAGAYQNVSMRGGAGNDLFRVTGSHSARLIDGGAGFDSIRLEGTGATLDFSQLAVSGIEKIILSGTGQTLVLGLEDIFGLMKESVTDTLTITSSNGNLNTFQIRTGTDGTQPISEVLPGGVNDIDIGVENTTFTWGGYQLIVDLDLLNAGNAVETIA